MPEFGSPTSGLTNNRQLTDEDIIRAIGFAAAGEYEAAQTYMQLFETIDNKLAVKVLQCVADEERVHKGESPRFLYEHASDEEKPYAKGAKEVKDGNQENEVQDY